MFSTDGYWSPAALVDIFSPGQCPSTAGRQSPRQSGHSRTDGPESHAAFEGREEDGGSTLDLATERCWAQLRSTGFQWWDSTCDPRSGSPDPQGWIDAHVMELEAYRPELPPQVISMADVLEHMPFPVSALQATARLAGFGGASFCVDAER